MELKATASNKQEFPLKLKAITFVIHRLVKQPCLSNHVVKSPFSSQKKKGYSFSFSFSPKYQHLSNFNS